MDSAASNHKGSTQYWAIMYVESHEHMYRMYNHGASKLPTAKAAYWNYKNTYTSEEFAFTYNLKRLREIRTRYDPDGLFRLPERKNQGSTYIDSCFAPYHCSGNG